MRAYTVNLGDAGEVNELKADLVEVRPDGALILLTEETAAQLGRPAVTRVLGYFRPDAWNYYYEEEE